jgi:hypothetical protein
MFSPKYLRLLWTIAAAKAISRVASKVSSAYVLENDACDNFVHAEVQTAVTLLLFIFPAPLEAVFKGAQISGTSRLLRVTRIAWTPTWPPTFRSSLRS